MRILAGDVGGTKTLLALVEREGEKFRVLREERFESRHDETLAGIVNRFLEGERERPDRACVGVAAPVTGNEVVGTNLPWTIDRISIGAEIGILRTAIINDFDAVGYGIAHLAEADFLELQQGTTTPQGPIALLGAGTGLGEAFLLWEGGRYRVHPTEGGHADFAPRNALEFGLFLHLRERLKGRVSVERVLSGSGLAAIYDYLVERDIAPDDASVRTEMEREDPAAVVSRAALEKRSEACVRALDLFTAVYGSEAGNHALRILATGGVYVGGGIAPKIAEKLEDGTFMSHFLDKGRFSPFLETLPVRVILSSRAPLLGAASVAARLP
ncbi:MAG: glucokinase [Candidatus Eisenbacteria bacterium]